MLTELVREHVQKHLGVGVRVQMAMVVLLDEAFQLVGVHEIAVVREADPIRRVHVERLRLGQARAAGRRVAHVPQAHVAGELQHVPFLEHVADQAVALANAQPPAVVGHDACRILSAVLEDGERIVERLVHGFMANDSDESTHV